jgi:indole-3-glycerol phosphate synthase/phosphoribosylanthranilate isomerase
MTAPTILQEITTRRRERMATQGVTFGSAVPDRREMPVTPFPGPSGLICEIKRRSPSKGFIGTIGNPVAQAALYHSHGAGAVSVLTELDYFDGTLDDLMQVKRAHSELAVLRKDFLLEENEIDVSFRAGADAVLLIAAILDPETLGQMVREAARLGIAVLVEVHSLEEVELIRSVAPALVGINSRDLRTFTVDRTVPLAVAAAIDWECDLVYESGIAYAEDARLARAAGFAAVLVGETAVAHPGRLGDIAAAVASTAPAADAPGRGLDHPGAANTPAAGEHPTAAAGSTHGPGEQPPAPAMHAPAHPFFWRRLYAEARRPLVKVCGITNRADAEAAVAAGADVLGFIFAPSPRRVEGALLEELADIGALKVAVVVAGEGKPGMPEEVPALLAAGLLDAVQFHGSEAPPECAALAFPYYKALRLKSHDDVTAISEYRSPRVLIDAFDTAAYGGTGKQIDEELIAAARQTAPLWLAGGLTPENVGEIVRRFSPELIDVSSGVEAEPGRKDHEKIRRFLEQARPAGTAVQQGV